jgi:hypothetical protein
MASTPTKTIEPMTPERATTVVGVVLDDRDEHDAAAQLDQLLQRPGYRHHLTDACAATQEILLGHADAEERAAAAETLDAVAIKHGVTLRFRAGTMDGAGGTMVALVDARTALATPTKRRALADENRRRADADAAMRKDVDDASDASGSTLLVNSLDDAASASTAPLLRDACGDETSPPPSSPLTKPRKRERGCWCRG